MTPTTANPLLALAEKWKADDLAEEVSAEDIAYNHAMKHCAAELTALAAAHEGMVLVPRGRLTFLRDRFARSGMPAQYAKEWAEEMSDWLDAATRGGG